MTIDLDSAVKATAFGKVMRKLGHWHSGRRLDHNIVLYCTGGYADIKIENEIYRLQPDGMLFIPQNSFYLPLDAENFDYYFIHFDASVTTATKPSMAVTVLRHTGALSGHGYDLLSSPPSLVSFEIFTESVPGAVSELFHRADRLRPEKSLYDKLMLDSFIREIIVLAGSNTEKSVTSSRISKITDYMSNNYNENITLTSLSERFHLSPSYIAHLFKSELSEKPSEYLNRLRIAASASLLLETEMSITEIAENVGYSSLYYFSRVFKKIMGKSPIAYRNSLR